MEKHFIRVIALIMAAFALIPSVDVYAGSRRKAPATGKVGKSEQENMPEKYKNREMPDFAYPQTVIDKATVALRDAMAKGDGQEVVNQVVLLVLGNNEISSDRFAGVAGMVDSIAAESDQVTASLLYSLEAQMYSSLYTRNRYKFDQRTLSLDRYPSDPYEWSKGLLSQKVISLVEKAVAGSDVLAAVPVKEWESVLTPFISKLEPEFYPDLYSVIAQRSIVQLKNFTDTERIPFTVSYAETPSDRASELYKRIINTRYELALRSGNVAALTVAYPPTLSDLTGDIEAERLIGAYKKYSYSPYAIEFLIAASKTNVSNKQAQTLHDEISGLLSDAVKAHPDYANINGAINALNNISVTSISGTAQQQYVTGQPIKFNINISNFAPGTYLHLFRLSEEWNYKIMRESVLSNPSSSKFILSKPVEVCESSDTCVIDFGAQPIGQYIVCPSSVSTDDRSKLLCQNTAFIFDVSDLSIVTVAPESIGTSGRAYVLDAHNGTPLPDVRVQFKDNDRVVSSSKTNSDGYVSFPAVSKNNWVSYSITARKGADKASKSFGKGYYTGSEDLEAKVYTNLSIYHPGDTCRFGIVAYDCDPDKPRLLSDKAVMLELRNASGEVCDSLHLTTDKTGRASGVFHLPRRGMLGRFSISVIYDSDNIGSTAFNVEEYKQPTFFVEAKTQNNTYKAGDDIRIEGRVMTYSGMPLVNAAVTLSVVYRPPYMFGYYGGESRYSCDVKTDRDGNFSLLLPTENLKDTKYTIGVYTLRAKATSSAGESQESEFYTFYMGNASSIDIDLPTRINASAGPVKANILFSGGTGEKLQYSYVLKGSDNHICKEGVSDDLTLTFTSDDLPSGKYTLTVTYNGEDVSREFALFRTDDKVPPVESVLWLPNNLLYADKGAKSVKVPVGSSYPGSKVLYTVYGAGLPVVYGLIDVNACNVAIDVQAPTRLYDLVYVQFAAVHDGIVERGTVRILPDSAKYGVEVKAISFRDKINAGGKERWKFRYTYENKPLPGMPVIATLSDKALNSIVPFRWAKISVPNNEVGNLLEVPYSGLSYFNFSLDHKYLKPLQIEAPWIDTYGLSLSSGYSQLQKMLYGARSMPNEAPVIAYGVAASKGGLNRAAKQEVYDTVTLTEEEAASEEAGVAESGIKADLRPSECPSAFFMPGLSTDGDGVLEISFEAPDFNTTWQLQMLAYLPDLRSSVNVMDAVASKPVMVSANPPRFLRTGDRTLLQSVLFNNTGKEAMLSAKIEIFDPLTDRVLFERLFSTEQVGANAERVVGIEFTVPSDIEFIGYRVIGESGAYADGEQSLIAIHPSSSPVIDSYPFYLAVDSESYSMKLPKMDDKASVVLQYCDNPVWYCVTALPDMSYDKSSNIFSRVNALYGNAVAAGLAKQYPQLRDAIKAWTDSADSTLVSPLQRNPELKAIALENTPWVSNAAAETIRMSRLANLLDSEVNSNAIENALAELAEMQSDNGGWSWCPGMDDSMFITGQIMWRMGMLKSMGYLPESKQIDQMLEDAVKYIDGEILSEYKRNKHVYSEDIMLNWLYVRSFFPSIKASGKFGSLKNVALKAIVKGWKKYGIYGKATAATLLYRENYPMEARSVLESLRQTALSSPERGVWFDNLRSGIFSPDNVLVTTAQALEAFAEIEPGSPMIDGMRQWLVIQRQAQDWGSDQQLAEVVYVILSSGSDWTVADTPASFSLDGRPISIPARDRITGSFTVSLDSRMASGAELSIVKGRGHQSWGGVCARYIAPVADVKAFSESDVSIAKRLLVVDESDNGTTVRELGNSPLKVGQRIRVELTVTTVRDIDYATVTDERPGCLAPADQVSRYTWQDGIGYYREVRNDVTDFFFYRLPRGTFIITYDTFVSQEGEYANGIATLQSLYAPMLSAHSAGQILTVNR